MGRRRFRTNAFALIVVSLVFTGMGANGVRAQSPVAASVPLGPVGNAFYNPPSPLPPPSRSHGDLIWARPLRGATLADAAANTLVLYHTLDFDDRDVAVSGTVAIPRGTPPPGGWPVVSWAHGTTGNAPQCAPSRNGAPDFEQTYLDAWVARGYAVVQTDYEGQGTPGLHPYLVGAAAARDVTDIVRAARQLYPAIGTHWFVLGHSEGGSAALFTSAIGPGWAPELHLEGAVSFAPASHIASVLQSLPKSSGATQSLPFILEMIEGIASTDPKIHLSDLLTREASNRLPALQTRCETSLENDYSWIGLPMDQIFRPGADIGPLLRDFAENESNRVRPMVPVLLLQGDADEVVSPRVTAYVALELCANGGHVTFDMIHKLTHGSIVTDTIERTEAWVDAVAAENVPASTCPSPDGSASPNARP